MTRRKVASFPTLEFLRRHAILAWYKVWANALCLWWLVRHHKFLAVYVLTTYGPVVDVSTFKARPLFGFTVFGSSMTLDPKTLPTHTLPKEAVFGKIIRWY